MAFLPNANHVDDDEDETENDDADDDSDDDETDGNAQYRLTKEKKTRTLR